MLTLLTIIGAVMTQVFGAILDDSEMRGMIIIFIFFLYPAIKEDMHRWYQRNI